MGQVSCTINDHLHLVINALHPFTYVPHFVAHVVMDASKDAYYTV